MKLGKFGRLRLAYRFLNGRFGFGNVDMPSRQGQRQRFIGIIIAILISIAIQSRLDGFYDRISVLQPISRRDIDDAPTKGLEDARPKNKPLDNLIHSVPFAAVE